MGYQVISQIVMVLVSLVVIFTYIQPKFMEIQVIQNQTESFSEAVAKASQFNDLLRTLVGKVDDFSQADLVALDSYLPNEIDPVRVARDLKRIVESNGMVVEGIDITEVDAASEAFVPVQVPEIDPAIDDIGIDDATLAVEDEFAQTSSDESGDLIRQQFELSVLGQYEDITNLLQAIESNAYPLYLVQLDFSGDSEGDLDTFVLKYDTFALTSQP